MAEGYEKVSTILLNKKWRESKQSILDSDFHVQLEIMF